MSKVTGECLRRFEHIESGNKDIEERVRNLEKIIAVSIGIVATINFIWIFFIYPWISKIHQIS